MKRLVLLGRLIPMLIWINGGIGSKKELDILER